MIDYTRKQIGPGDMSDYFPGSERIGMTTFGNPATMNMATINPYAMKLGGAQLQADLEEQAKQRDFERQKALMEASRARDYEDLLKRSEIETGQQQRLMRDKYFYQYGM